MPATAPALNHTSDGDCAYADRGTSQIASHPIASRERHSDCRGALASTGARREAGCLCPLLSHETQKQDAHTAMIGREMLFALAAAARVRSSESRPASPVVYAASR